MKGAGPRLAVLGDPLKLTLSPRLHRAGLAALGMPGDSEAIRTGVDQLGSRLRSLAEAGCRGANLTHPLKEAALAHLKRVGRGAQLTRSVNTVGLDPEGWWGESTDGPGFVDLLDSLGRAVRGLRVVLLGAGGAARSLAWSLLEAGAGTVVAFARNPDAARPAWSGFGPIEMIEWSKRTDGPPISGADLIVNCTPLAAEDLATDWGKLRREVLVIDLVYGLERTAWVEAARARGLEAHDGLGLLVHQARRSLELWFGKPVPLETLSAAVGWPR